MIQPLASALGRRLGLGLSAAFFALVMLVSPPASVAHAADRLTYVLFSPGTQSVSMSGSTDDVRRARTLRVGTEALLYFRDDRGAYVVRDAETLRQARAIFQPQEALGARQAELGSRQAALGRRQAALGKEQARIGARQAAAAPGRSAELGRQQNALGQQQRVLSEQQRELGRQQSALGQEQRRLGQEAQVKFHALLQAALQRGLAQRVN